MIYSILKSVLVTSCISSGIAFFLTHFNVPFLKTFLVVSVVQIVAWEIYRYYTNIKLTLKSKELDVEIAKEIAIQTSNLQCAYCKTTNTVNIRLDKQIRFNCESCNRVNSVYVTIEVAQVTHP